MDLHFQVWGDQKKCALPIVLGVAAAELWTLVVASTSSHA